MSFSVKQATVDKVEGKLGVTAKAVVQAFIRLCPMLSIEQTTEETDAKYSAILQAYDSAFKIKIWNHGAQIAVATGRYSDGDVSQMVTAYTDAVLEYKSREANKITITVNEINDAMHTIGVISDAKTTERAHIVMGKLKSAYDGKERPFLINNGTFESATTVGAVLADSGIVQPLQGVKNTLAGHNGAADVNGMPLLVMTPTYLDCASQFLGFPTIGSGMIYYTNQSFVTRTLYTINGRRYYFLGRNTCLDVS